MKSGSIAVIAVLVLGSLAYYFLVVKKDNNSSGDGGGAGDEPSPNNGGGTAFDNFEALKKNLGNLKADKDNVVAVAFNTGKNTAQFYNNNRIIVFASKAIVKGTYSDGGKKIAIDGGGVVTNPSVFKNLLSLI